MFFISTIIFILVALISISLAIYNRKGKRMPQSKEVCGSYFQQIDNPEYITALEAYSNHTHKTL